jgi:hypothetical protein
MIPREKPSGGRSATQSASCLSEVRWRAHWALPLHGNYRGTRLTVSQSRVYPGPHHWRCHRGCHGRSSRVRGSVAVGRHPAHAPHLLGPSGPRKVLPEDIAAAFVRFRAAKSRRELVHAYGSPGSPRRCTLGSVRFQEGEGGGKQGRDADRTSSVLARSPCSA